MKEFSQNIRRQRREAELYFTQLRALDNVVITISQPSKMKTVKNQRLLYLGANYLQPVFWT